MTEGATRRRATRPATFPEDAQDARREAYDEWSKSAHERGRQIEHNEGCLCTTCRSALSIETQEEIVVRCARHLGDAYFAKKNGGTFTITPEQRREFDREMEAFDPHVVLHRMRGYPYHVEPEIDNDSHESSTIVVGDPANWQVAKASDIPRGTVHIGIDQPIPYALVDSTPTKEA